MKQRGLLGLAALLLVLTLGARAAPPPVVASPKWGPQHTLKASFVSCDGRHLRCDSGGERYRLRFDSHKSRVYGPLKPGPTGGPLDFQPTQPKVTSLKPGQSLLLQARSPKKNHDYLAAAVVPAEVDSQHRVVIRGQFSFSPPCGWPPVPGPPNSPAELVYMTNPPGPFQPDAALGVRCYEPGTEAELRQDLLSSPLARSLSPAARKALVVSEQTDVESWGRTIRRYSAHLNGTILTVYAFLDQGKLFYLVFSTEKSQDKLYRALAYEVVKSLSFESSSSADPARMVTVPWRMPASPEASPEARPALGSLPRSHEPWLVALTVVGLSVFGLIGVTGVMLWVGYCSSPTGRLNREIDQHRLAVRALDRKVSDLDRWARSLLSKAATEYADDQRRQRRIETPLESLRTAGAVNVRWAALRSAGVRNLEDLLNFRGNLSDLPGVGPVTAERVMTAARTLRAQSDQLRLTLPAPGISSRQAEELVRGAIRVVQIGRLLRSADMPELSITLDQIRAQTTLGLRQTSIWAWLTRSAADVEAVSKIVEFLKERAKSPSIRAVQESLRVIESTKHITNESLREAYTTYYVEALRAMETALSRLGDVELPSFTKPASPRSESPLSKPASQSPPVPWPPEPKPRTVKQPAKACQEPARPASKTPKPAPPPPSPRSPAPQLSPEPLEPTPKAEEPVPRNVAEGALRPQVGLKSRWSFRDFKNADFLALMQTLGIPTGHPGVSWRIVGSSPQDCQTQALVSLEKTGLQADTLLQALPRSWRETEDLVAVPVYWFTSAAFPGGPKPQFIQTADTPAESYSARMAQAALEVAKTTPTPPETPPPAAGADASEPETQPPTPQNPDPAGPLCLRNGQELALPFPLSPKEEKVLRLFVQAEIVTEKRLRKEVGGRGRGLLQELIHRFGEHGVHPITEQGLQDNQTVWRFDPEGLQRRG